MLSKHKIAVFILTEEQERTIMPLIQGAVCAASPFDIETISREQFRAKAVTMALSVEIWFDQNVVKNRKEANFDTANE